MADAATVAWMLGLMATLLAEAAGLVSRVLFVIWNSSDVLRVLSSLMLFVALAAGSVTLILTPAVLHFRRQAPPRRIVIVAVAAGLLPFVALFAQRL